MRTLLIVVVAVIVIAQFLQPDRSVPPVAQHDDLFATVNAPEEIRSMVKGACYDCHSYETEYPWYSRITPVNYWLQDHIVEGRKALNFSRWNEFAGSKHARKCGEELLEGEMPPPDYERMHDHAQLSPEQTERLAQWFNANLGVKE